MKQQLTQAEKEAVETQDTTLRLEGLEIDKEYRGFRVIVGSKKGSGMFAYSVGNRTKADKVAKNMKETGNMMFKRQKSKKLCVVLEPCILKRCKSEGCKGLCEKGETYCMRCEDNMYDAMCEAKSMSQAERLECEERCDYG